MIFSTLSSLEDVYIMQNCIVDEKQYLVFMYNCYTGNFVEKIFTLSKVAFNGGLWQWSHP